MTEETTQTKPSPRTRIFICDGREFPDPNPTLTVDEVRGYFTTYFPELANAETVHTERPAKVQPVPDPAAPADGSLKKVVMEDVYEFQKRVGKKGSDQAKNFAAAEKARKGGNCWPGWCGVQKIVYPNMNNVPVPVSGPMHCPKCGGAMATGPIPKK
jgi:PRTRC genetic system protein C